MAGMGPIPEEEFKTAKAEEASKPVKPLNWETREETLVK